MICNYLFSVHCQYFWAPPPPPEKKILHVLTLLHTVNKSNKINNEIKTQIVFAIDLQFDKHDVLLISLPILLFSFDTVPNIPGNSFLSLSRISGTFLTEGNWALLCCSNNPYNKNDSTETDFTENPMRKRQLHKCCKLQNNARTPKRGKQKDTIWLNIGFTAVAKHLFQHFNQHLTKRGF